MRANLLKTSVPHRLAPFFLGLRSPECPGGPGLSTQRSCPSIVQTLKCSRWIPGRRPDRVFARRSGTLRRSGSGLSRGRTRPRQDEPFQGQTGPDSSPSRWSRNCCRDGR